MKVKVIGLAGNDHVDLLVGGYQRADHSFHIKVVFSEDEAFVPVGG